jgi:hypothetical protein
MGRQREPSPAERHQGEGIGSETTAMLNGVVGIDGRRVSGGMQATTASMPPLPHAEP